MSEPGQSLVVDFVRRPIGVLWYDRTPAEVSAGITPSAFQYEPANVLRYGADRTGASNSTTAFASAIAVVAQQGHGRIFVPFGKYLVNLDITTSGVHIEGEAKYYESTSVGLYPYDLADYVIDVGSASAFTRDFSLSNISVHGQTGGDLGLRLRNVVTANLHNGSIRGFDVYGLLITGSDGFGTAFINFDNFSIAGNSTGGSIAARVEADGTGFANAINFANADLHSAAGGSFALDMDNAGDSVSVNLANVWVEAGNNRGIRIDGTSCRLRGTNSSVDSGSSADVLLTLTADGRVSDFVSGSITFDGVASMPLGNTAALSSRHFVPNEALLLFPHVQGSLNFQNASAAVNAQHVVGNQNQRIGRNGTNLAIISSDGSVQITAATGAGFLDVVTGALRLRGAALAVSASEVSFGCSTQSTVGAAGAASALPATPSGYLRFFVASTEFVIPYYARV